MKERFRMALLKLNPMVVDVYRRWLEPRTIPNLKGDRDVQYSWIVANLPDGPGKALDFGCGSSWMGLAAARKGFGVTCIDLVDPRWFFQHPNVSFHRADLLRTELPPRDFDVIICCSTVEHVGLVGRFGVGEEHPDGDLDAMDHLRSLARPGGRVLLTIPVGRDRILAPHHRVYGDRRLPQLLKGWDILREEYWVKDATNRWRMADRGEALAVEPSVYIYSLGLFVLERSA